jgi:hypothetical protein
MMLQACLGLSMDATTSRVVLRSPSLPKCVDRLSIRGLTLGSGSVDLTVHRYGSSFSANVERRSGRLDVVILS